MHKNYPHPSNWQDFERLCRDLYAAEWADPDAQLNGRNGDDQGGVDVFGREGSRSVGVQCKLREQWIAARLTARQVREEVEKAKRARAGDEEPRRIDILVIATTAVRSGKAQQEAIRITKDEEVPFDVRIDAWDELNSLLNKHRLVRNRYMGWDATTVDSLFVRERDNYLQSLCEKLRPLPMAAIHKDLDNPPTLDQVYTAIDVEYTLQPDDKGLDSSTSGLPRNDYLRSRIERLRDLDVNADYYPEHRSRRLRATECLAAWQHAVLLGPPGSGKSAFVRYVALCLAGARRRLAEDFEGSLPGLYTLARPDDAEQLTPDEIWPFGALIPLIVELREFSKDERAFPKENEPVHAAHFLKHLTSKAARYDVPDSFLPCLRNELLSTNAGRGVLLLLDGLDETSDQGSVRTRLRRTIEVFAREYPNARILVTCRPYAYDSKASWWLPDFHVETLAELSELAIKRFVHAWYGVLAASGTLGTGGVGNRPDVLLGRLGEPSLRPLAARPLTLTLVTSLHASGLMGEGGRAEIYERGIELFFDRWNEVRLDQDDRTFLSKFGLRRSEVLAALQRIAYRVHLDASGATGIRARNVAGQIPFELIWDELMRARGDKRGVTEADLLDYLDNRAGILLAEGNRTFRFPHRSFQEYLAALYFGTDQDFPDLLVKTVRHAPVQWREVLAFAVLRSTLPGGTLRGAWDIVDGLLEEAPADSQARDSHRIAIALARAFAESSKLCTPPDGGSRHRKAVEVLRCWLVRCLKDGALTATDRAEAGEALGKLGDTRLSDWRENLLPVPGTAIALGRFVVTVQDFEKFVLAGGYEDPSFWRTESGNDVRRDQAWTEPAAWANQLEHPNRPVVGVSWYEATAYCAWLSKTEGIEVSLPDGEDRLRAAQPDNRTWPWGNEPDLSHDLANFERKVGHPTPVGCYARGAGEFKHLDLGGNIWEWCSSESPQGKDVRGGAWTDGRNDLRADYRVIMGAINRLDSVGFRVCTLASPLLTD